MKDDPDQFSNDSPIPGSSRRGAKRSRRFLSAAVCLILVAAGCAGYWHWSIESSLSRAAQAMKHRDWVHARQLLTRYLQRYPDNASARLLIAEALVKSDHSKDHDPVHQAIEHLSRIGDDSPLAARARLQEARLSLLILRKPATAERLLTQAIALSPDSSEAQILMWKLLDLTGRHVISRDYFWRAYESSAESQRAIRLREWFLSEFYPEAANAQFYDVLGARQVGEVPASVSLLVIFREQEPEASFLHAGLAAYYLQQGLPKSSLELLRESPEPGRAMDDPFFVSVLLETLIDLGEFEKAGTCYDQFPTPHDGYLYWHATGLYHQYVNDDAEAAIAAYDRAMLTWPAKFDWGLMMKLSECLRKTGQSDRAVAIQDRVQKLTTEVLTIENTSRMRSRMRHLNDPAVATAVRDMYSEFGLTKEADAWNEHGKKLDAAHQ